MKNKPFIQIVSGLYSVTKELKLSITTVQRKLTPVIHCTVNLPFTLCLSFERPTMSKMNMSFVMCTIDQFLIQIARIMRVAEEHNRKSAAVGKPCETCIKSNTKIHRSTVI